MINREEILSKLRMVKSAEEYRTLALENGEEMSLEDAEKAFAELQTRLTPDNKVLDEDELASVTAGFGLPHCENTANGKCHSTVEDGSWCGFSDACFAWWWVYDAYRYMA